jgi:uncharacterized membrane protein YqjE
MPEGSAQSSGPSVDPANRGLAGAALQAFGSVLRHLQALLALAQVEAKEASVQYLKVLVYGILGLLFLAFGYVSFLLFIAFLLGWVLGVSWLWITLGLTLLHFALVAICAWQIRNGIQQPIFPALLDEIRRDTRAISPNATSFAPPSAL